MSDDVIGRLKGLCGELHARIEASADYKTLKAVERALQDIEALSVPATVSAVEATNEAVASAEAAGEVEATSTPDAVEDAAPVDAAEAEATVAPEAAEVAVMDEAAPEAQEEAQADAPAETEAQAEADVQAEASANPEPEVVIPEMPAEDRAIVAELVAATSEGLTAPNGTTTP